jgi:hypothetical protein
MSGTHSKSEDAPILGDGGITENRFMMLFFREKN